jgi:DNA-binding CsgD family transcriptional regulator
MLIGYAARLITLTRREREILAYLRRGHTNRQIAHILFISPLTVRRHLENVYEKLGVHSRTAAAARAFELEPHADVLVDAPA